MTIEKCRAWRIMVVLVFVNAIVFSSTSKSSQKSNTEIIKSALQVYKDSTQSGPHGNETDRIRYYRLLVGNWPRYLIFDKLKQGLSDPSLSVRLEVAFLCYELGKPYPAEEIQAMLVSVNEANLSSNQMAQYLFLNGVVNKQETRKTLLGLASSFSSLKSEEEYSCTFHPGKTGEEGDRCPVCSATLVKSPTHLMPSDDTRVAERALSILVTADSQSAETICIKSITSDSPPDRRFYAAVQLSRLHPDKWRPHVLVYFSDDHCNPDYLRIITLHAPKLFEDLLKATASDSSLGLECRLVAFQGLLNAGNKNAIGDVKNLLTKARQSDDFISEYLALHVLGKHGSPKEIPALASFLEGPTLLPAASAILQVQSINTDVK